MRGGFRSLLCMVVHTSANLSVHPCRAFSVGAPAGKSMMTTCQGWDSQPRLCFTH